VETLFNALLSTMERTGKNINEETEYVINIMKQANLKDIYNILHLKSAEYTILKNALETIHRIHSKGFSDHSGKKLQISNTKEF
jgi:hypothetical protein